MILASALSTPRPLPREREHAEKRARLKLAGAVPAHTADIDGNSSGPSPAKTIRVNEAPLARRKPIQTKKGQSASRLANLSRLEALRVEIRSLIESVVLCADIELLDLMRDEIGSYSRHKAVQDARTWASAASVTLETGLMQLDRALHPTREHGRSANQ